MEQRALRNEERQLVLALLPEGLPPPPQGALVEDAKDGGMGSIRFVDPMSNSRFGREAARAWYIDADGMPVSISIYLNQRGELFEVDFWKVDFSGLIRYPLPNDLTTAMGTDRVRMARRPCEFQINQTFMMDGGDGDQSFFSHLHKLRVVTEPWFTGLPRWGAAALLLVEGGSHAGQFVAITARGDPIEVQTQKTGVAGVVVHLITNPSPSFDNERDADPIGMSWIYCPEIAA